jgi:hypothetical protein
MSLNATCNLIFLQNKDMSYETKDQFRGTICQFCKMPNSGTTLFEPKFVRTSILSLVEGVARSNLKSSFKLKEWWQAMYSSGPNTLSASRGKNCSERPSPPHHGKHHDTARHDNSTPATRRSQNLLYSLSLNSASSRELYPLGSNSRQFSQA